MRLASRKALKRGEQWRDDPQQSIDLVPGSSTILDCRSFIRKKVFGIRGDLDLNVRFNGNTYHPEAKPWLQLFHLLND
jgi:hypothetical protein